MKLHSVKRATRRASQQRENAHENEETLFSNTLDMHVDSCAR